MWPGGSLRDFDPPKCASIHNLAMSFPAAEHPVPPLLLSVALQTVWKILYFLSSCLGVGVGERRGRPCPTDGVCISIRKCGGCSGALWKNYSLLTSPPQSQLRVLLEGRPFVSKTLFAESANKQFLLFSKKIVLSFLPYCSRLACDLVDKIP